MKRLLAVGAVLLAFGTSARADDSFTAGIVAGSIGQNLSNGQYAGTFSVTDNTTSVGPLTAFCADTTDDVNFGTTNFTGNIAYGGMPNSVTSNGTQVVNIWGSTPYPTDLGKRLDYLLTQILAPALQAGLSNAQASAIQAAIWQTEGNYVNIKGVTDPLALAIISLVNGTKVSGTGWSLLDNAAAYNTLTPSYASSSEFLIIPTSTSNSSGNPLEYQVLVGVLATPEPSTFAIAGLGALGFLAYGLKRRRTS